MDQRIIVVGAITLGTGLVGGIGAFLAESREHGEEGREFLILRHIVLGIIASACVPLFLSLVRSKVVGDIFQPSTNEHGLAVEPAFESYLIFVGLGLVAAFSSRRFIQSVTGQLFERMAKVEDVASRARTVAAAATDDAADARAVAQKVDDAVGEVADEPDAVPPEEPELQTESEDEAQSSTSLSSALEVDDNEKKILRALTKKTYRTRTGIAQDSMIPLNRISELLDAMHQRKLVMPTKSPSTGGQRWIITKRGHAALGAK